jgi:ActR/RegA family two-component response regulator
MTETEAFDINQRFALAAVDDENRKAAVNGALQELGFRVHFAATTDDGYDRLRKTSYEVVVIDQAFQRGTLLDNPLLQQIQTLPASTRRYMFVALLGPGVKTMDNMTAFAASVNAVINYNDLAQASAILQRSIAENDQFFRVLRSVLQEAGRR